jgi:chromosome segregation ATPase
VALFGFRLVRAWEIEDLRREAEWAVQNLRTASRECGVRVQQLEARLNSATVELSVSERACEGLRAAGRAAIEAVREAEARIVQLEQEANSYRDQVEYLRSERDSIKLELCDALRQLMGPC